MKNIKLGFVLGLFLVIFNAGAVVVTLGEQDFNDGDSPGAVAAFNASLNEGAPFKGFIGSDVGPESFNADFTFNFDAAIYSSASITIGIFDHDSSLPGNQVSLFSMDGVDMTAALNAAFEGHGGLNAENNIYTLDLGAAALAQLSDGQATFSLILTGETGGLQPTNGAILDFATLSATESISVSAVPEPSTYMLFILGLMGVAVLRKNARKN